MHLPWWNCKGAICCGCGAMRRRACVSSHFSGFRNAMILSDGDFSLSRTCTCQSKTCLLDRVISSYSAISSRGIVDRERSVAGTTVALHRILSVDCLFRLFAFRIVWSGINREPRVRCTVQTQPKPIVVTFDSPMLLVGSTILPFHQAPAMYSIVLEYMDSVGTFHQPHRQDMSSRPAQSLLFHQGAVVNHRG